MIEVKIYNDRSFIVDTNEFKGRLIKPYQEALRNELSYDVPNAEWSAKYKEGRWDGKISLYDRRDQSYPSGLSGRVKKLLNSLSVEYSFIDERTKPEKDYPVTCDFGGKQLRDYQLVSAESAHKFGRGMLSLCTGAGKTMTSCYLFSQIQVKPVVFIVPAIELLKQTQKEFEKYLKINDSPCKVGIAGGGQCDLNLDGINVITYQTALNAFDKKYVESSSKIVQDDGEGSKPTAVLEYELNLSTESYKTALKNAEFKLRKELLELITAETNSEKDAKKLRITYERSLNGIVKVELAAYKKALSAWNSRQEVLLQKSQIRSLVRDCKALIIDEAHLAAIITEEIGSEAKNAYYRVGLSATPWRTDNQEIRIEGTLGRKIIELSASDLIERGFLVPPKIFMVNCEYFEEAKTYQEVYSLNIVNNWERNYRIKQFAEELKANSKPTLILVERKEHGEILEGMIEDAVFVPGGDKGFDDPTDEEKNYRRRMLNAVENNDIVLIATQWANVGVDAPRISCLILAGSNQSSVTTYQQVGRVLRCVGKDIEDSKTHGKECAIIVDFYSNQKNLKTHSNMRKKVYKNERAWKFYDIK
jgi:superfamily II DNA or RNA helicase